MTPLFRNVVLLAGCLAAACGQPAPPVQRAPAATTDLDAARATLRRLHAGRLPLGTAISGIPLDGYNFSTEMDRGDGLRLLLISCNKSGGILGYRADGSLAYRRRTTELIAITAMDLDADGIIELAIDQLDGTGTGIERRNFHFYRVMPDGVDELWQGRSYELWWPPSETAPRSSPEVRSSGFLQPEGGGFRHVLRNDLTGTSEATSYAYRNGRVEKNQR